MLHEEWRLHNNRWKKKETGEKIKMSFEVGDLSFSYLSRPCFGHRITKIFEIVDPLSLAYVIGVLHGDGCAAIRADDHYYIDLQTKDADFAESFAEHLSRVLKQTVQVKPLERKTVKGDFKGYEVCKGHKGFYLWYKSHQVDAISIVESLGKEAVAMFLKGFVDSEGSPSKCISALRIYNKNIALLGTIQRLLQRYFGITSVFLNYPKHTCPFLCIYRIDNFARFSRNIGFSIKRKNDRLEVFLSKQKRRGYDYDEN